MIKILLLLYVGLSIKQSESVGQPFIEVSSKTKGINGAISNEFLARQGLMSLKDLWINIHSSLFIIR
ncbi:hypothetical protein V6255_16045 [Psychromonas arctica]|uniref:Uncharacterized protein n=1 Tax=Psychromonas arctica TaxID=168275 RepID=A0ABU9HFH0_9GAMM